MIHNKLVLRGHFMMFSLIWIQPGNDFGLLDGAERGWNIIFHVGGATKESRRENEGKIVALSPLDIAR